MMRSKVRNTQMGLEPCHRGWQPQPLMYVPYRWRAALCQLCPAWAHKQRLAPASVVVVQECRCPYGAWSAFLKAFRLINKCTTRLITNCFMIIEIEMKNKWERSLVPEVQTQVGDIQGLVCRKGGCKERMFHSLTNLIPQNLWECVQQEDALFCFFLIFIFIPKSPGSLNGPLTGTRGISCQGKTGPEVGKRKKKKEKGKKRKTGKGKNNNRGKVRTGCSRGAGPVCMGTNNIFSYKKSNSRQFENMARRVSPAGR